MSTPSFEHLRAALQALVAQGVLPGAMALVHYQGRTVLREAVGRLRPGLNGPAMTPEALFRIYSMTKPIASLAALMLMEEGRLLLSHPVSHYLPAFAGQQVYNAVDGTVYPPAREATVHDLMRHTAGLSYAWDAGPVTDMYRAARVGSRRHSNTELAAALGPLPLVHPPGSRWEYSRATGVLGAVLEAVEGEALGAILRRRVLEPLGMRDTGFHVPATQLHRLAEPFTRDPLTGAEVVLNDVSTPPVFESAGGGLVSTADDYARFLQIMLGRGTASDADGRPVRLVSRATVDFMTADHLGDIPTAGDILPGGYGFGLGVAVRKAAGLASSPASAGTYSWSGMAGTFFFVDPAEDLFALLLTQAPSQLRHLCELYPALVLAAL